MTDPGRTTAPERGPRDPRKAEFEANKLRKRLFLAFGTALLLARCAMLLLLVACLGRKLITFAKPQGERSEP